MSLGIQFLVELHGLCQEELSRRVHEDNGADSEKLVVVNSICETSGPSALCPHGDGTYRIENQNIQVSKANLKVMSTVKQETSESDSELATHTTKCSSVETVQCPLCSESVEDLDTHIKSVHLTPDSFERLEDGSYHCIKCNVAFKYFAKLKMHLKTLGHNDMQRCALCRTAVPLVKMKTHRAEVHGKIGDYRRKRVIQKDCGTNSKDCVVNSICGSSDPLAFSSHCYGTYQNENQSTPKDECCSTEDNGEESKENLKGIVTSTVKEESLESDSELAIHTTKCSSVAMVQCPHCSESVEDLNNHIKSIHLTSDFFEQLEDGSYRCIKCNLAFKNFAKLKMHLKTLGHNDMQRCTLCGIAIPLENINTHRAEEHGKTGDYKRMRDNQKDCEAGAKSKDYVVNSICESSDPLALSSHCDSKYRNENQSTEDIGQVSKENFKVKLTVEHETSELHSEFATHTTKCSSVGMVPCPHCSESVEDLDKHIESVHSPSEIFAQLDDGWYHCIKCNLNFKHFSKLRRHLRTLGHKGLQRCGICSTAVPLETMETHQAEVHGKIAVKRRMRNIKRDPEVEDLESEEFRCQNCDFCATSNSELTIHATNCDVKMVQCSDCSEHVKDEDFEDHIKSIHMTPDFFKQLDDGSYHCTKCNVTKPYFSQFKPHLLTMTHKGMERCRACDFVASLKEMEIHQAEFHGKIGDSYVCKICNKRYAEKMGLDRHIACVHEAKKVHKCEECGRTFARGDNLAKHKTSHSNLRQFQCSYCEILFKTKDSLSHHVKNIHLQNRYQCHVCYRGFHDEDRRDNHVKIHQKGFRYLCMVCGQPFSTYSGREAHFQSHLRNKKAKKKSPSDKLTNSRRNLSEEIIPWNSSEEEEFSQEFRKPQIKRHSRSKTKGPMKDPQDACDMKRKRKDQENSENESPNLGRGKRHRSSKDTRKSTSKNECDNVEIARMEAIHVSADNRTDNNNFCRDEAVPNSIESNSIDSQYFFLPCSTIPESTLLFDVNNFQEVDDTIDSFSSLHPDSSITEGRLVIDINDIPQYEKIEILDLGSADVGPVRVEYLQVVGADSMGAGNGNVETESVEIDSRESLYNEASLDELSLNIVA